eukprot:420855_1
MINGINVVAYVIDACDGVPDVYGANVGVIAGLIVGVVVGDNVIGVLVAVFVGAMVRYEYDAYNYKMVVRTYTKLQKVIDIDNYRTTSLENRFEPTGSEYSIVSGSRGTTSNFTFVNNN